MAHHYHHEDDHCASSTLNLPALQQGRSVNGTSCSTTTPGLHFGQTLFLRRMIRPWTTYLIFLCNSIDCILPERSETQSVRMRVVLWYCKVCIDCQPSM